MSLFGNSQIIELARREFTVRRMKVSKDSALAATIGWLCANRPEFKEAWNAATKDERRRWMKEVAG